MLIFRDWPGPFAAKHFTTPTSMARLKARQPVSWLVLLAFLFTTLSPSLAMGLGGPEASRTIWTQLCSVDGPELVAIQVDVDDDDPSSHAADSRQGHCLLCFQPSTDPQNPSLAPATAHAAFVLRVAIADTPAPRSAPAWSPALARAPPALS